MKRRHNCILILFLIILLHTNITFVAINYQIKSLHKIPSRNIRIESNLSKQYLFEPELNLRRKFQLEKEPNSTKYISKSLYEANSTSFKTVAYNMTSKSEERYEKSYEVIQSQISPSRGNAIDNSFQETIFPPDNRTKVTETTVYPWTTICKLYITAEDDTNWIGSGAIIDEFFVLTAGHNVYLHDNGGWAKEIKVVPGKDDTYEPYGYAFSTYVQSYEGWIDSEMDEHDWAVLTLDRNIGNSTGWMGIKTDSYSDPMYTGDLHTAGYPGDLSGGEEMYQTSGSGDSADEYNHYYWLDAMSGQSGSPVWQLDGNDPYILSIFAYSYNNTNYPNYGTRINTNKFNSIISWLGKDTPTIDKPDLTDKGAEFSSINPTIVYPGQTNFQIISAIENLGSIDSGIFNVSYYISPDSTISTSDELIGSEIYFSIGSNNYRNLSYIGRIPISLSDGNFYVGWIIDSNNDIDESDETNNKGLCLTSLSIIERPSESPLIIFPIILLSFIGIVGVGLILTVFIIRRRNNYKTRIQSFWEVDEGISKESIQSPDSVIATENLQEVKGNLNFCSNCGSKINIITRFCKDCGFKIE